jgi:aspartate 1-decarboxylase
MLRKVLRSKIHQPRVTACDPDYVGSITLDPDLLRAADIRPNESVLVADIETAARFETYVIRGERGAGEAAINGAAANLVNPGDRLIVLCFALLDPSELDAHQARVIVCDANNAIAERLHYTSTIDAEPAETAPL